MNDAYFEALREQNDADIERVYFFLSPDQVLVIPFLKNMGKKEMTEKLREFLHEQIDKLEIQDK